MENPRILEHINNILLYMRKDADTTDLEEVKISLGVAMQRLEVGYDVHPDYASVANADLFQLGLRVLAYDSLDTQDEAPAPAVAPTLTEAEESEDFNWKGEQLRYLERFAEAVDEYTRAIQLCPKSALYFYNRATTYFLMENYELCIDDCLRAIKLRSTYGEAWGLIGLAYYEICEFTTACEAFKKAIELIPTDSLYKDHLKNVERQIKNKFDDPEPDPAPEAESKDDHGHQADPQDDHRHQRVIPDYLSSVSDDDEGPPYYKSSPEGSECY